MYIRTVKKQILAHPLINLLIIIQMCVVFAVSMFTISIVEAKLKDYYVVKDLLASDGLFCGGSFLSPEKEGEQMKDTDYIKNNLKNVDVVSTISFAGFQTGVKDDGEVDVAYTLIYDDFAANLYKPRMADGVWITESSDDCEYPQAVITENPFGYKVGDVIKIDGDEKELTIKIIGIIGDNEKYLATNTSEESREPSYTVMFRRHFNKLRDELANQDMPEDEIEETLGIFGYEPDSDPYNQPEFLFSMDEWKKTGEECYMSNSLFIKYNDDITDEEKLYNLRFMTQEVEVLSFALRFSDIEKSSLRTVNDDIDTLVPIIVAVMLLALIGSLSSNAINCKTNMKNYSVYYLCGSEKKNIILINLLHNCVVLMISLILSVIVLLLLGVFKVFKNTVIHFSMYYIPAVIAIAAFFVILSCIVPLTMIKRNNLSEALKSKENEL